jgi:hypothetical protein
VSITSVLDNWGAVMRLRKGTDLRVEDASGRSIYGELVSADQLHLTVDDWQVQRTVARTDVRRVFVQHDHSGWIVAKVAGLGAALGGLVGGLIGTLVARKHRVLLASVFATAVGLRFLFYGAIISIISPDQDEVLVYSAT